MGFPWRRRAFEHLTAGLLSQPEKVTNAGQRADAARRVNAWNEARSAKKEATAAATAPPSEPPGHVGKLPPAARVGPSQRYGWTEQFPALPETQTPLCASPRIRRPKPPPTDSTKHWCRSAAPRCAASFWCSEASCHSSGCKSRQQKESSPCCSYIQRQ